MTPREEMTLRNNFYHSWCRTGEAACLHPPRDYGWLLKYPNNFKKVREAFHRAWITYKMTEL